MLILLLINYFTEKQKGYVELRVNNVSFVPVQTPKTSLQRHAGDSKYLFLDRCDMTHFVRDNI